jgi:predicted ferric reductase
MRQHKLGNIIILFILLLNPILWYLFPPIAKLRDFADPFQRALAEVMATTAMAMMTISIVLSLRFRIFEPYFGGLDQMYKTHKTLGTLAVVFLIIHYIIILPSKSEQIGLQLGVIAFVGIVGLVLISLIPRLTILNNYFQLGYHQWKWTHKLLGLFFIVGNFHALNVNNVLVEAPVPGWYWKIMTNIGMFAYVYRELIQPWLQRPHKYNVMRAESLNPSTLELELKPASGKMQYQAGQFAFIRFPAVSGLTESHPFTISSAPNEQHLRFSIKACGDWTKFAHKNAKPNMTVLVEGPYGRMNYKLNDSAQIWIAGGIGITPFASWMRDFDQRLNRDIHFYYTVRAEKDAIYWEEFERAMGQNQHFFATLNVSSVSGSLTAEKIAAECGNIAQKHIYMCGPLAMTMGFTKKFKAMGVPNDHLHFEEFNFR